MNFMKTTALAALVVGSLTVSAIGQDKTYTIGVSVPTADHGWTGGVDFFAQQAVDRLSKAYRTLSSCSPPLRTRPSRPPISKTW